MLERMIRLREAKRAMKRRRYRDALGILASPPLSGQRDALDLRDTIFRRLMKIAADSLARGDLGAARDALTTARVAGHEGEEAVGLMAQLTRAEREQGEQQHSHKKMLSSVRRHVAAGSLIGAMEKLEGLDKRDDEVERMRKWVEARARDLDRYLSRCREALENGRAEDARAAMDRAESVFPHNPEINRLKGEVLELERKTLEHELGQAIKSAPTEAAWKRYLDAVRRYPALKDRSELKRFRTRFLQQAQKAARTALERGQPDQAASALRAALADADDEQRLLASGIQQWRRARELASAGEFRQALELYRAAFDRIGANKVLKKELQTTEASQKRREETLSRIGQALEAGDYELAVGHIDVAIGEGEAPGWLTALRREVGSCLDAGAAALLEVTKQLREGRTTAARLGLIPLLSRKETRDQALALWREVDARESTAASLLGRAEAIVTSVAAGKSDLIEALKAVEDALASRSDHPKAAELKSLINRKKTGWDKFEEATTLEVNGQLDAALKCCREGLQVDPTHGTLRILLNNLAGRRAREIVREVETLLTHGDHERARRLLARSGDLPELDVETATGIQQLLCRLETESKISGAATGREGPQDSGNASTGTLDRFMLRVEEGPEALVLTEETVRIGNARNPMNHIAIMANISSSHASLHRELSFHGGVTYVLRAENGKECLVNGERVREAVLSDGDEVQLGADVRFRFCLPDSGSACALIEIVRGYHVDDIRKILLMKRPGRDGRIRIGNTNRAHLKTRHADRIVELYIEDDSDPSAPSLAVAVDGEVEVNGERHNHLARLDMGSFVCCGPCRFQIGRAR